MTDSPLSGLDVRDDRDLARARSLARAIADRLGYGPRDRAGIASAVSEIAGAAVRHAGGGRVDFRLEGDPARSLTIRVVQHGPAEPDSCDARCLAHARALMDGLEVDTAAGPGTAVAMSRRLPEPAPASAPPDAAAIARELIGLETPSAADEIGLRERELLGALEDLEARERQLAQISRELEDTNRGVLALYLELDERAESLRRADELKTRFLSHVSHELRTPLSSILGLARLLLDRVDGELSVEQDRQVGFIHRSAQELAGLVNDLLDLARIEAGREVVRPSEVHLPDLFGALRGMLRPLIRPGSAVDLVIEEPEGLPAMVTDDGKLAQVLRNFLSNALKFTERGEVRLRAEPGPGPGETIVFTVTDTGIGIEPGHLPLIFEEFGQVDGPLQRKSKGTGLGLPVARKLARLLGGDVGVRSEPGAGSTFTATIPVRLPVDPEEGPPDGRT